MVAVVSEAGVGKSRLYAEFLRSPSARACLVLETGCVSYRKAPYLPIIELLRAYFQVGDHEAPFKTREKVVGKLASLDLAFDTHVPPCLWLLDVPVEDSRWERLDPEQRRRRALEAARMLLLNECRLQPVIVVFEDLHWIDAESQAFLDSLVDGLRAARLLLLVNYRPEYQHGWAARSNYRYFRIGRLPPETADELMDALLGPDPSLRPLKGLLAERTDGNPLFIEEMVRTLRETNTLVGNRGAHRLAPAANALRVPATVQAVLAARIDRLPDDQKRLLQCAAVIGTDVPFALLLEVGDVGADELRGRLAQLQAAELLHETQLFPDIEYTFGHTLTHDVAYEGIVHERRKVLHARIAEAIERLHAGRLAEQVERLAHHTSRAEAWDKAVGYLRWAGDRALARSASREAAELFAQALSGLGHLPNASDTQRLGVDLRLDLRAALYALGEFEPMLERLREADALARKLDDPRRVGVGLHLHRASTGVRRGTSPRRWSSSNEPLPSARRSATRRSGSRRISTSASPATPSATTGVRPPTCGPWPSCRKTTPSPRSSARRRPARAPAFGPSRSAGSRGASPRPAISTRGGLMAGKRSASRRASTIPTASSPPAGASGTSTRCRATSGRPCSCWSGPWRRRATRVSRACFPR